MDKDPIVDTMRTLLTDREITIKKLSAESGVCESTIRNLFYGETKRPQHATLQAILRALGLKLEVVGINYHSKVNIIKSNITNRTMTVVPGGKR